MDVHGFLHLVLAPSPDPAKVQPTTSPNRPGPAMSLLPGEQGKGHVSARGPRLRTVTRGNWAPTRGRPSSIPIPCDASAPGLCLTSQGGA